MKGKGKSMNELKLLKVTDLEVSKINPRFPQIVLDEVAAIHQIIEFGLDDIITLVDSIKNGWEHSVFILVNIDGDLVLMDGNRRLTAVKLLLNPDLIPEGEKYEPLRLLCKDFDKQIFDDLIFLCEIFESMSDKVYQRLEKLHIGNDPTKSEWGYVAQYNFAKLIGTTRHPQIKTLLNYFTTNQIDKMLHKKNDIYRRALTTRENKELLKIDDEGKITLQKPKEIISDIKSYIENEVFNTRSSPDFIHSTIIEIIDNVNNGARRIFSDEKSVKKSKKKKNLNKITSKSFTIAKSTRYTVFHPEFKLPSTGYQKVDELYHQLRTTKIYGNKNTLAIVFRSFLQMIGKLYSINTGKEIDWSKDLFNKLNIINIDVFSANGCRPDNYLYPQLKNFLKKQNNNNHINGIVHDLDVTIDARTLIDWADLLKPLIEHVILYTNNVGQED